ncbi:MAG: site-2 protease family protein [Mariniblastus sp.]|nr:site-2 protease family protein [Mariniblastus sp.]
MFLAEPGRTPYDLNFSLFGFPVRVHPAFLVLPLLIGSSLLQSASTNAGVMLLLLVVIFFVSILVHELGHAFAFRYYGQASRIVIYWMGGLAIPEQAGNVWSSSRRRSIGSNQQIVISLAGPVFGFILAGLIIVLILSIGGHLEYEQRGLLPILRAHLSDSIFAESARRQTMEAVLTVTLFANVFINVLNLAPVFPLDGGQVARQLFLRYDPYNGVRYSIIFSMVVAILIAVLNFQHDQFIALFFGFMAWSNYMTLQQMSGGMGGGRSW